MATGWKHRVVGVTGTVLSTCGAVLFANHPISQAVMTRYVPPFDGLEPTVLAGSELLVAVALSVTVVFVCLLPLYKPRPRRALDTVSLAQKRVLVALFALATIGYFNWSYRLPRTTLFTAGVFVFVIIPTWFLVIRNRPSTKAGRALIVGDDPGRINQAMAAVDMPVIGYLAPSIIVGAGATEPLMTDGGVSETVVEKIDCLGGISRLESVLVRYHVDDVVLAFENPDRGEFFGVLEICHMNGVETKVLREHANSVLHSEGSSGDLMTVDLEPWDWQDRLFKRGFDVLFSAIGLLVFTPLLGLIALAIKLDSRGPVFYTQSRTAGLGGTFEVRKFRTMFPESESVNPVDDGDNDRITRVGRLLRKSDLDELPQLWAIFIGEMSVVGPRAVWVDEERLLEREAVEWRKRWFVKPGLTGLAQINDVTSTDPKRKLQYDLEYIRRQSFQFDIEIVLRQFWVVLQDIWELFRADTDEHGNQTE